eukprot:m51a1_g14400 putative dead-box atp-dependent rna helicase 37-like (1118) ;mRNA; f:358888-378153
MGYDTSVCGVLTLSVRPSVPDPAATIEAVDHLLSLLWQRRVLCTDVEASDGDWDAILGEFAVHKEGENMQGSLLLLDNNMQPIVQPALNCCVTMRWLAKTGDKPPQPLHIISGRPYFCWAWLQYIISRVLEPRGVVANGQFLYQGESLQDKGRIVVRGNIITCLGCASEDHAGTTASQQVMTSLQRSSLFDLPVVVLPVPVEASPPAQSAGDGDAMLRLPDAVLWDIFQHLGCSSSASALSVHLAGVCSAWRRLVHKHTHVYRLLDVLSPRKRSALLVALPLSAQAAAAVSADLCLPRFPGARVVDLCCLWLLPHQTTLLVRNVVRAISPASALAEVVLDGAALERHTLEELLQGQPKGLCLSLGMCGGITSDGILEWLREHVANGDIGGLKVSPFDGAGDSWIIDHMVFSNLKSPCCSGIYSARNATRMAECPSVRQVAAKAMGTEIPGNFFDMFKQAPEQFSRVLMLRSHGIKTAPAAGGKYIPPAMRRRLEEEQAHPRCDRGPSVTPPPSFASAAPGSRRWAEDEPEQRDRVQRSPSMGELAVQSRFEGYRDPPASRWEALREYTPSEDRRGGGIARGGRERDAGGRGGSRSYGNDRWHTFRDTRHNETRGTEREDWFKTHEADLQALEDAQPSEDPYSGMTIDVSGSNPPQLNVETFHDIDLGDILDNNILKAKYMRPMPVQKAAIPIILAQRDLMACAQTGSGKTAAFLLPLISSILYNGPPPPPPSAGRPGKQKAFPQALVLAPTRELACQIYEEALKFAFSSPVRSVVVYGGADVYFQMRELERGCDILVATPGRLVDLLERVRVSLSQIKYLVLDEADRMLDMGFEPQIRRIVEKEDMTSLEDRQTLMFSATFPKEIQRLASDFLKDYLFLTIGRVGSTVSNIIQRIVYVDERDKRSATIDLLQSHPDGLTLIFVETKKQADMLEAFLCNHGFMVTSIHGDRTQQEREGALRSFRDHRTPILVATDVAARGLDIPNVLHVINFDLPQDIDNYVHRIGRTGRAGKAGLATAFVNERNKSVFRELHDIMVETNQEIPDWFVNLMKSCNAYPSGGYRRGGGRRFGGAGPRDYRRDGGQRGGSGSGSSGGGDSWGGRDDRHSGGYGGGNSGAW